LINGNRPPKSKTSPPTYHAHPPHPPRLPGHPRQLRRPGNRHPAPDFTAKDKDGKTVSLADFKGKTVVLEWYNPGCPYVKKFYDVGAMQNAQKEAIGQGVVWLVINSGKHKLNDATGYYPATVINDEDKSLARAYEAKVTPHCFVIDAKGNLAYKGAIDSIASVKSADIEKATNYVAAAIKALKDGKAPEVTTSKPYGCGVKY
jgi:peroxiredoxin